jgi:hypothetical protein
MHGNVMLLAFDSFPMCTYFLISNKKQGDHIGRIFAYRAIVQFGQPFKIQKKPKIFRLPFSA